MLARFPFPLSNCKLNQTRSLFASAWYSVNFTSVQPRASWGHSKLVVSSGSVLGSIGILPPCGVRRLTHGLLGGGILLFAVHGGFSRRRFADHFHDALIHQV